MQVCHGELQEVLEQWHFQVPMPRNRSIGTDVGGKWPRYLHLRWRTIRVLTGLEEHTPPSMFCGGHEHVAFLHDAGLHQLGHEFGLAIRLRRLGKIARTHAQQNAVEPHSDDVARPGKGSLTEGEQRLHFVVHVDD